MPKTQSTKPAAGKPGARLRRAGHPVPGLVGPLLQFDLDMETEKLRQEDVWKTSSRNSKSLVKYPDLRIVLIALKSGKRIEGHKTDESISIQVLSGKLRLHLPSQTVELLHGQLLTLERGLPHDVEALEDSSFLLTISWPRSAARVKPAVNRWGAVLD
ncbi:MAG: cupin domain-containing protein [Terriglobia bacterium]